MKKYLLFFSFITTSLFGSINLQEFETQFDKAYQEGLFKTILETRRSTFKLDIQKLEENRSRALTHLCDPSSNLEICQRIQRIVSFQPTNLQVNALKYLESLQSKPLNSSNSPLENQLIALAIEHDCKNFYVDFLFSQGKISLIEKKGMKVLFKIEKMQKMVAAASHSNEHAIGRLIEEADHILGSYQTYQEDIAALETTTRP